MATSWTYEWAIGKWNDRKTLIYVPIDYKIDEKEYDTCNLTFGSVIAEEFPYKMEDAGEGIYYVTYSSNDTTAIIRITKTGS